MEESFWYSKYQKFEFGGSLTSKLPRKTWSGVKRRVQGSESLEIQERAG